MITELYTFSPGSFVVAQEWNANFKVLDQFNISHAEAITDAYNYYAFPNSDLTGVFNAVKNEPNSHYIENGTLDKTLVYAEQEYYGEVASQINIGIPVGVNGEVRVLVHLTSDQSILPFNITYDGGTLIFNYDNHNTSFSAGYYYIMIYESNNVAQAKLIWTGV